MTFDIWHVTRHMSHVTCHMSHATCHMSHVTCHMSPVTCHMSHVTCHISNFTFTHHMPHVTCHMSADVDIFVLLLHNIIIECCNVDIGRGGRSDKVDTFFVCFLFVFCLALRPLTRTFGENWISPILLFWFPSGSYIVKFLAKIIVYC